MTVSYDRLKNLIEPKGISLKFLFNNGIITHYAYSQISKGNPVSLKDIDNICQYLNVPIEQVVEIIPDVKTEESPE